MEERLKGMKKRALALFMAVMLTLQMTGCSTGTKEQDTTAENKTQSSIKDLFNSGKNGKEDAKKEQADKEKETEDDKNDIVIKENEADGEESGREEGMKLSMFDISDPAELKEVSRFRLEDYDYSEALWDHRAVLIDTGENILGFGAEGWRNGEHYADYFLFSFEDGVFVQTLKADARLEDGSCGRARGTFIGDVFYLLFENGTARAYDRKTGGLLEEVPVSRSDAN